MAGNKFTHSDFTIFSKFLHILITSGSGHCVHYLFKTCEMAAGTSVIRQSYFWRVFYVCPSCATVAMRRAPYVALLWSVTRSGSKPADNYLLRPADARWLIVSRNFSDILINLIHLKFRYFEKATKIWHIL